MNRYIVWIVISIFFNSSLFAKELSMLEFRHQQRVLTLSSFKALFKKRNMATHKRKLKEKYKRIKHTHNSNIISNMRTTEIDTTTIVKTITPILQIKSNNELNIQSRKEKVFNQEVVEPIVNVKENIDIPKIEEPSIVQNDSTEIDSIEKIEPNIEVEVKIDIPDIIESTVINDDVIEPNAMIEENIQDSIIEEPSITQEVFEPIMNIQENVEPIIEKVIQIDIPKIEEPSIIQQDSIKIDSIEKIEPNIEVEIKLDIPKIEEPSIIQDDSIEKKEPNIEVELDIPNDVTEPNAMIEESFQDSIVEEPSIVQNDSAEIDSIEKIEPNIEEEENVQDSIISDEIDDDEIETEEDTATSTSQESAKFSKIRSLGANPWGRR